MNNKGLLIIIWNK